MMEKKYEFTGETKEHGGHTLHRIRALRSFGDIYTYDFGGWIESEDNLSHDGGCWVGHEAMVYGKSIVRDNGRVRGHAVVTGHAIVSEYAIVSGYAVVTDNAIVAGHTIIDGYAIACGNVVVRDKYVNDQEIVSK